MILVGLLFIGAVRLTVFAQVGDQTLTKVGAWNAYVHLPSDYATSGKSYPAIVFIPGVGEVGTNAAAVLKYGPGYYISKGHKMEFMVDGKLETPIVISLQPDKGWPSALTMNKYIDSVMKRWRIDVDRLYMTGLSMGGWSCDNYISGGEAYAKRPAAIVSMSAPDPDFPLINLRHYAYQGGVWWGFEGTQDYRKMDLTRDSLNNARAGTARYTKYVGTHCCWNTWYNPEWRENGESIYEWMLRQKRGLRPVIPNTAPKANAGADQQVLLPTDTTILYGSGTDKESAISAWKWRQISGPSTAVFTKATVASTKISGLKAGTYVIELMVTDYASTTALDTMKINVVSTGVSNIAPVAVAGTDQLLHAPASSALLNGSASFDSDGMISNILWQQIAGPAASSFTAANALQTTVNGLKAGTYSFSISVTDNSGAVAKDTVNFIVNQLPVANAGADQVFNSPVSSCVLNGSSSADADGTITSVQWLQIAGPATCSFASANTLQTTVTGLCSGTFNFVLTVTDNRGAISKDIVQVLVAVANQLPVANAGADKVVAEGAAIGLSSAGSTDADGSIISSVWTITNTVSGVVVANLVAVPPATLPAGKYLVQLKVTDDKGAQAVDDMQLIVNAYPVAKAGADAIITLPANSVSLTQATATDAEGQISSYSWTRISGPGTVTFTNANTLSAGIAGLAEGLHSLRLQVTDNYGLQAADTMLITVKAATVTVLTSKRNRILIDCGAAPSVGQLTAQDKWGKYWNNMTNGRAGVQLSNAKDTANNATGLGIEVIERLDGTFGLTGWGTNGGNTIGDVGDYPATATNDNIFAHSTTTTGRWRVFGLNPALTYNFKFWGTRTTYGVRTIQIKRSTDASYTQESNSVMNVDYNNAININGVTGVTEVIFNMQVKPGQTFGNVSVIDIVTLDNAAAPTAAAASTQNGTADDATVQPITQPSVAVAQPVSSKAQVWPNPATSEFSVKVDNNYRGAMLLQILNASGAAVKEQQVQKNQESMAVRFSAMGMKPGLYYVKVQTGAKVEMLKLMIQ
ncbi:PKD domain-containing protein [Phnomibacter sp. MR]|uniref:PKD domain-containing protein n=1 Tax=Phnomibacter sp. MR TaxID=3042318 RepID=UPI003A811D6A